MNFEKFIFFSENGLKIYRVAKFLTSIQTKFFPIPLRYKKFEKSISQ